MARSHLVALALAAVWAATPARAQVRIVGRVIEAESARPIAGADVVFRTPEGFYAGRRTTDAGGFFSTEIRGSAGVRMKAERLGYRQNLTPVLYFDRRSFYEVEIRLDADAVLLAPLEVIARGDAEPSHFLDDFRYRVAHGNGIYITRADIVRQRPQYVTDLLRSVSGLEVTASGAGSRPVVQSARGLGHRCETQVFVDGLLLNRRVATPQGLRSDVFRIDDAVAPDAVEGIEIYLGLSTTPPEFLTADAECGVVAIWTRRGDRP